MKQENRKTGKRLRNEIIWLFCFPVFLLRLATFASAQAPTLSNVAYGPHERQVLDFWKAQGVGAPSPRGSESRGEGAPAPCLFFVHGGGWMGGDKANPDFLANCLDAGISVVSINYRFIPDAIAEGANPPVKACLEDAARALQFVRSKAGEWNIDKTRIGGSGGSAGGFTSLWLAFHPDMADAKSADPVARESTRLRCVLTFVPQTTLDPRLMREWIPNNEYGHHAFALASYQEFLEKREQLASWIDEYSPLSLVSPDDPPTYLFYDSTPTLGQPAKDPPHSANFGVRIAEKLKTAGVECEFNHRGATDVKHPDIFGFLVEKLKAN